MDLINEIVTSKNNSKGIIVEQDDNYITVNFNGKIARYNYSRQSLGFISSEKREVQEYFHEKMNEFEEKEERKKIEKEKAWKKTQEKKESTIKVSKKGTSSSSNGTNYAFKCNYCDGGANENQVGFSKVCSDRLIRNNIDVEHRSWCMQKECLCMKYHDGEITRKELDEGLDNGFICYEAYMLTKWEAFAGVNNSQGEKQGKARTIPNLCPGKLCILTTRDPLSANESERYVFAAFIIGACDEGDENSAGFIRANMEYTIKFNNLEAHKLKFWDYHRNANAPDKKVWGMGLYRKFGDEEAMQFLDAIVDVKKGTKDEQQALKIRNYYIDRNIRNRF